MGLYAPYTRWAPTDGGLRLGMLEEAVPMNPPESSQKGDRIF